MISFKDAVKQGFKKSFDFSGRATRAEYWWWILFNYILIMFAGALGLLLSQIDESIAVIPTLIFILVNFIPSLAVTIRRLHDAGHSGWALLLNLIPYLGGLIIFAYTLCSSEPDNEYGPNPHKKSDSVDNNDNKKNIDIAEGASQDTQCP